MTCAKFRYRDEIAAKIALARAQRKDSPKRPKTEQRAYRCPDCRGWHLTSKGKPPPTEAEAMRTLLRKADEGQS